MCGFVVTKTSASLERISKRGPDALTLYSKEGFSFVHALLSITGDFTTQPFIRDDVVCLYNGEIYNHAYSKSDGENILPLYEEHGVRFASYLQGEYAIAIYDFKNRRIIFSVDPFKTKPLFIRGPECASYRSALLGSIPMPPNTTIVANLDGDVQARLNNYNWSFEQHKRSYDDWISAFERSVLVRAKAGCFIGLSSGYDSGAISLELNKAKVPYKAYSFDSGEDISVLKKRIDLLYSVKGAINKHEYCIVDNSLDKIIKDNVDDERYTIISDSKRVKKTIHADSATLGLATIARKAKDEGRRIYLSGQGADEILSDYCLWPSRSTFKGFFPKDLKPWINFTHSCQQSYLMKEDYVSGSFGLEARYPFLDLSVVQEFLWLHQDLKNKAYKAPLEYLFTIEEYPFEQGVKRGFVPSQELFNSLSSEFLPK